MTIAIVTDSTCDLPQQVIRDLGITVIPLSINIDNRGYLDGVEITRQDFYKNLPYYTAHPSTGTVGLDAFTSIYTSLYESGCTEILSIHISEKLSATVDVARSAARSLQHISVSVRDSGQLSLGTGFQVEAAARMAARGESMHDILAALDELMPRTFVAARLDTLEYLRRSGRMNGLIAGLGSLLQIKPILTMQNGQPASEKVRTREKAEARLIRMLEEHQPLERFTLLHTHCPADAEAFRRRAGSLIPAGDVLSMDITPVLGVHLGPGAVGYALIAKSPAARS